MKYLVLGMLMMTILHAARADEGLQGTIDPDYFQMKPESLDNPFVAWARPLTGGAVKAVFIVPLPAGREVAELQRRIDVEAHTVLVKPHIGLPEGQLGFNPGAFGHYNAIAGFTQPEMIEKLNQALEQKVDLIVIGNVDWSILTAPIQQRIESLVQEGVGLMLVHQPPAVVEAWRTKIESVESRPASPESVALPRVGQLISDAVPSTRREPDQLWTGQYGKGRVSILHWQEPPGDRTRRLALVLSHALTPSWPICEFTRDGWAYEFEMAAVIKSVLWTARREPTARISSIDVPKAVAVGAPTVVVATIEAQRASELTLEYVLRDLTNTIVHRDSIKAPIAASDGRIEWPVTPPGGGTFALDVVLRDGRDVVDFAAGVIQTADDVKLAVTIHNPLRMPGQPITGKIDLQGTSGPQPVQVDVYDAKNRLLASTTITVDDSGQAEFSLQPIESLSAYNRVVATRRIDGVPHQQAETHCIVDRRDQTRDQYHVTMWNWSPTDFLTTVFLKRYAELGIDSQYHNDYFKFDLEHLERGAWEAGRFGIEIAPYVWRESAYAKKDLRDVTREPVLSAPSYRDSVKQTIAAYTNLAAKFAPPFSSLGDEPYLIAFWEGVDGRDVCFAPETQAAFRVYLKEKYGTIEALNESWATSFTDWEQASPIIFEDAMAQKNLARWLDHRQHMTRVFQGMLDFEQQVIHEIDPRLPAGPEGMYPWDPFKGYDFEQMSRMGFVGPYGTAHGEVSNLACAQIAAWHATGNRRMTIAGWYNTVPRSRQYSWGDIWWSAFYGYNGALYFLGDPGSTMSGFTPDHRPTMYLSDTLSAIREFRAGIFQLIQSIQRNQNDVAILHSEASYILSLSLTKPDGGPANPVFAAGQSETLAPFQAIRWVRLLNDIGIPHTHMTSRQVEAGSLRQGVRVLILPVAICLTDREEKEIRDFVAAGGIVVADVLPGVLNQNGGPRAGGALDDVFGVRHTGATLATVDQMFNGNVLIEQSGHLKLESAKSAGTIAGNPVFIQRQHGGGSALLMNTTMLGYDKLRKEARHGTFAGYVSAWLKNAGVRSRFRLLSAESARASTLEMIPYVDGSSEYLAIVKQPKYTPAGSEPFHVKLPAACHVYDVRQQKYFGQTSELKGDCAGDNPRMFAMLPYRIEGVSLRVADRATAGEAIRIEGDVVVEASTAGRHVIRLDVNGPAGELKHYTQVIVAQAGRFQTSIPTAFNDARGEWTVKATEIVSGLDATVHFTLD